MLVHRVHLGENQFRLVGPFRNLGGPFGVDPLTELAGMEIAAPKIALILQGLFEAAQVLDVIVDTLKKERTRFLSPTDNG